MLDGISINSLETKSANTKLVKAMICLMLFVLTLAAKADFQFVLEGGSVWQNRNDVQIPPNTSGTRVEIDEFDEGPFPFFRAEVLYRFGKSHGLRALYAPLTIEVSGTPESSLLFDGQSFAAGNRTDFTYTFNSYRLTYFYALWGHGGNELNVGFTAKLRDAETEFSQGSTVRSYTNQGFVPLLYFDWLTALGSGWYFNFTGDALGGGPGRAIDVAIKVRKVVTDGWTAGVGYRTLEGGADNDTVFTFSWFNFALAELTASF